jgi:hypothetical protein
MCEECPDKDEPVVSHVNYWVDSEDRLREEVTIERERSFEFTIRGEDNV